MRTKITADLGDFHGILKVLVFEETLSLLEKKLDHHRVLEQGLSEQRERIFESVFCHVNVDKVENNGCIVERKFLQFCSP